MRKVILDDLPSIEVLEGLTSLYGNRDAIHPVTAWYLLHLSSLVHLLNAFISSKSTPSKTQLACILYKSDEADRSLYASGRSN